MCRFERTPTHGDQRWPANQTRKRKKHSSRLTAKTTSIKAKTAKTTSAAPQIKKDGKGRFWLVPKDGSAEQGPFETKQAALATKAGIPAPKIEKAAKGMKPKKAKEPKEKKVSAIDARSR